MPIIRSRPQALAALIATAATLVTTPVQAAGQGTITIDGSVPSNCQLVVRESGEGQRLDILGGVNSLTIGSVGRMCNVGAGYRVTLSSANRGALVNERGDRVTYDIAWYELGRRTLANDATITVNRADPAVQTRSFRVWVPATPQAIAGNYSDTITLTIAAR